MAESGFDPYAGSSAGAQGIAQTIPELFGPIPILHGDREDSHA